MGPASPKLRLNRFFSVYVTLNLTSLSKASFTSLSLVLPSHRAPSFVSVPNNSVLYPVLHIAFQVVSTEIIPQECDTQKYATRGLNSSIAICAADHANLIY